MKKAPQQGRYKKLRTDQSFAIQDGAIVPKQVLGRLNLHSSHEDIISDLCRVNSGGRLMLLVDNDHHIIWPVKPNQEEKRLGAYVERRLKNVKEVQSYVPKLAEHLMQEGGWPDAATCNEECVKLRIYRLTSGPYLIVRSDESSLRDANIVAVDLTHLSANLTTTLSPLAYKDPLTGLPNRRVGIAEYAKRAADAQRHHLSTGIVFIDMDYFKDINDSLGHHVGDQALKKVASILNTILRESDTPVRWGGDEFVVVAPYCKDTDSLKKVADKIRTAIENDPDFDFDDLRATASIGGVVYRGAEHPSSLTKAIKATDEALKLAKQEHGRNCTVIVNPDGTLHSVIKGIRCNPEKSPCDRHVPTLLNSRPRKDL